MGITLKKLRSDLKNLQIGKLDGADLILKGIELLVKHADSPWAELIKGFFPATPLVIGLLKAIKLNKSKFDLDTCAALAIQQAYLDVFQTSLKDEKGTLEARFDLEDVQFDKMWRKQLETSVEQLMEYEIEATQLDFPNLHNEPLVKNHFERVTADWLRMRLFRRENEELEAVNFARRISYQLYPQLLRTVAEHGEFYAPLAEYLETVNHRELRELRDIEKYRAYLMELPLKPIFNEMFALKDLYVELDATEITRSLKGTYYRVTVIEADGDYQEGKTAKLMSIVFKQLEDREHVIFIQAGPGKGKSVFCQMLAARIAAEYPDWIPVFVRLRDERFAADKPLEEAVRDYIKSHFTLTDDLLRTRRFLFILDGFDELWLSTDSSHALKFFFERLSTFQKECAEKDRWRHKIIVTGRPMRIQDIESELPSNFFRLNIENMDKPQFEAWLRNWTVLFGKVQADQFRAFLEQGKVFEKSDDGKYDSLRISASEPLLLYMLSAMHRDGALTQDMLETSRGIEIYDRAICWVCGDDKYERPHWGNRVLEKSGIQPYELRQLLQETALCVWQGGREFAPIERIRKRLSDMAPEQTKKLFASGLEGVHNLLASFYFQRHEGESGNVEFSHKTFGEYLAAERMVEVLIQIGERIPNSYSRQEKYRIKDIKDIVNLFYSVFGAALLSPEVQEFVIDIVNELLSKENIEHITNRLYRVYLEYSNGRWMNEGVTKTQWDELKKYEINIGLLEFEVKVGINLFLLLCLLYQKIDKSFHICGKEKEGTFDPDRFRRLIGFGEHIEPYGFFRRTFQLLKNVNLSGASLGGLYLPLTNFSGANLQGAILLEINLRKSNLQGTNLRKANLERANLEKANLKDANLEEAYFRGANLQGADLQNADLSCTSLVEAELQRADLRHARLQKANFVNANVLGAKIYGDQLKKYEGGFSERQMQDLKVVDE